MPSRRSLLGSLGVLLTAGCSQQSQADNQAPADTSTTTTTTTTTSDKLHVPSQLPWGESTTYDGTDVTPIDAWRQHSVITLTTPDSFGVEDFDATQLLFVTIAVIGTEPVPQPADFAIDAAGERYPGWTSYRSIEPHHVRLDNGATAYDPPKKPNGWIAFALPPELGAETPRLRLQFAGPGEGATRWPLPDGVTKMLNAPAPHTKLDQLEVPESAPAGESFDVTLTATNHGKGPGMFRAAVNEAGPQYMAHAVRLSLSAGETRETVVPIAGPRGTDADETTIRIVTTNRTVDRTVTLE